MNSLHDLGGMHGFGRIEPEPDEPVFHAPWEGRVLALHRAGVFQWSEWAAMLAEEIRRAQAAGDPDTGATYYRHWQATLERMIVAKGVSNAETIDRYSGAWAHAARRTPHGMPIKIAPEDF